MTAGPSFLEQLTVMDVGIGTDIYRCMLWQPGKTSILFRSHGEKSGRRSGNEASSSYNGRSEELMKLKKLPLWV